MSFIGSTKIPVSLVSFAPALCAWCFKSEDNERYQVVKWRVGTDSLEYIDNRSEHEVRDQLNTNFGGEKHRETSIMRGTHLHRRSCLCETVGGDLTIKVENNTETGEGIYAEPVDNPDQQLDDAEIHYAIVGNLVLLKIRPYQESSIDM